MSYLVLCRARRRNVVEKGFEDEEFTFCCSAVLDFLVL